MPDIPPKEKQVRAHVIVRGRVQGVFFRGKTCDIAEALGLAGWVRNEADGSVEAVFEGPETSVRRAVSWCETGPALARVRSVDVQWEDPTGEFDQFSVRY